MIRVIVMAVLLVGITTGCGRYYWSRPGGTFEQFDRDHLQCTRDSIGPHGILDRTLYQNCLTARGWARAKQLDPPLPYSFRGHE
jgi:hypothetical protein